MLRKLRWKNSLDSRGANNYFIKLTYMTERREACALSGSMGQFVAFDTENFAVEQGISASCV
jgi:hypothetical protein